MFPVTALGQTITRVHFLLRRTAATWLPMPPPHFSLDFVCHCCDLHHPAILFFYFLKLWAISDAFSTRCRVI